MFIINQHETNADQIVYFKSQSDSQRYWDFFIENKNVIPFQYVNPLLFAGKGYTYNQIQKLDFLNCIVPIPVFSCRFVKKYKELLKSELQFFPCKIKIKDKTIDFFLGRILKSDNILDLKRSGSRTLTDGSSLPDVPFFYQKRNDNFYVLRDCLFKSHYIVSKCFADLCEEFNIEVKSV